VALFASPLFALPAFAAATASSTPPDIVIAALVGGACALGLAGAFWAFAESRGSARLRRNLRNTASRARALIAARDALIAAGREAVIVWGPDLADPLSFSGGAQLLEACLRGEDATTLSTALDALSASGSEFTLTVRDSNRASIRVRGRPAGHYAAVYLEAEAQENANQPDFRGTLDALPQPVWIRGRDLALKWVNRAFLVATGATSVESALHNNVALDRTERDIAAVAIGENEPVEAKRYAVMGGQRRALSFALAPLDDGGVAGTVIDVTAVAEAEAKLQQHVDAHAETLDRLATAVAIFGGDRKLAFYNRAYVKLWGLAESWLDSHPTEGEILDRLRELRRLPEQRDFLAWKRDRLRLFETIEHHPEELWHLPGGKTLRVVAQPHPFGGLIFLYEDVSDQMRLESSYQTFIKVQRATLDTLQEGVAVFGPDGRLKLHNAAFARIWRLEAEDLAHEPHVKRVADLCAARFGHDRTWGLVYAGVTSAAPERRREVTGLERSDGMVISLSLAPLPDGAMLVSFVDATDRFHVESALRERNQALEAADRLKSEFVKRVSYELRTPLNSIVGFAELLKTGAVGELNTRQQDYIDSVVKASNTLRDLINDILDLSEVEAGAMELDLESVDLHTLLAGFAEHGQDWAAKIGLTLRLDCREDAGAFLADLRRLRQVIFNLLSNALKYTPRGGTITLGGDISDNDVRIFVSDTGPGIPAEIMPSAFERFSAKGGASGKAGAGLGLALVNRFVELHGGWVELASTPGEGTTVTCHLPRSRTGDIAVPPKHNRDSTQSA
jgi:signal transduction histidine kinase